MKPILAISLLLLASLLLSGCSRDTQACFTARNISGFEFFNFDASCAVDAVSYDWDFGDGGKGVGRVVTYHYSNIGTYEVTLVVTDENGHTSSTSRSVSFSQLYNRCRYVTCQNAICDNGICICYSGYEGQGCTTKVNQKFVGNYVASETCGQSASANYPLSVTAGSAANLIYFDGLWETPGVLIQGIVANNGTTFTIARQAISGNTLKIESVYGEFANGNQIVLRYNILDSSGTIVHRCSSVFTK